MGNVLSGLVLESRFQPKLLPLNQLPELAEKLFSALIQI
jgi:hypothetical protein